MNPQEETVIIPAHRDMRGHEIQMRRILGYRDYLKGADDVLLLGAGPSGKNWRDHVGPNTYVMACNSAIIDSVDRADAFATVEATAVLVCPEWYYVAEKQTRFVSYKNICYDSNCFDYDRGRDVVPVERSWHAAGFNPSEYVSEGTFPNDLLEAKQCPYEFDQNPGNPYYKCHTFIGYDKQNRIEYGLIKGPICYPFNMAIGTVLSAAVHLMCFMGVKKLRLLGFDLSWDAPPHFAQPGFKYKDSRWVPPEAFITVNGIKTLWHFALTGAWIKSMYPLFAEHGMTIENLSGGILDIPNIESMTNMFDDEPRNVEL